MSGDRPWARPGVPAALGAALLFGAGTPLAKRLLLGVDPWMLAGLLYLGSGIGLGAWRLARRAAPVRLARAEALWFAAAVGFGGVLGPVLLMLGLRGMAAAGAALLLNAESVFTALLAWFVFRENFDRRIALGMLAIVAGAVLLGGAGAGTDWSPRDLGPAALVLGAIWSWWRTRYIYNLGIALGGIVFSLADTLAAYGVVAIFFLAQILGIVLLYWAVERSRVPESRRRSAKA